jgi:molybdopterin-guanine dinucleotide biosynthesis protein A
MKTGGIILCGGRSTRMGRPKAALPFGPETMLARVARLLGEAVHPLVVVAAPDQEVPEIPSTITVVRDRRQGRGPLEGLSAGLAALDGRADAAYATSCDVPLLVPAFVLRMGELLASHEIAVPVEGEFHHPLAAVYRLSARAAVERLLAADRLRPLFLFDECDTRRVPVEELRRIDPALATLRNLNHPGDYEAALAEAGFAPPE